MKFPVINKAPAYFPDEAVCPWCKKEKVFEPHSFVVLNAGALLTNSSEELDEPSEQMEGFFEIYWHGAHSEEGGLGKDPETGGSLSIVKDVEGGQFDLYFCSTQCLRSFFNHCVDQLEASIE